MNVYANFAYGVFTTKEVIGTESEVTLHYREKYTWCVGIWRALPWHNATGNLTYQESPLCPSVLCVRCNVMALSLPSLPKDGDDEAERCFILRVTVIGLVAALGSAIIVAVALAAGATKCIEGR